jgi:hypothetical protein
MKKGVKIPISLAKSISKEYTKDQVIILTWEKETNTTTVTTFGRSQTDCEQAAEGGNVIKKTLGWPNHLTEDKPARQRRKEEKINKIKEELLAFKETLKADHKHAIEMQEADVQKDYNEGREEGITYALEMLEIHFKKHVGE